MVGEWRPFDALGVRIMHVVAELPRRALVLRIALRADASIPFVTVLRAQGIGFEVGSIVDPGTEVSLSSKEVVAVTFVIGDLTPSPDVIAGQLGSGARGSGCLRMSLYGFPFSPLVWVTNPARSGRPPNCLTRSGS